MQGPNEAVANQAVGHSGQVRGRASFIEKGLYRIAICTLVFTLLTWLCSDSWYLFDLLANLRLQWLMAISVGMAIASLLKSFRCLVWFTAAALLSAGSAAAGLWYSAPVQPLVSDRSTMVRVTSINLLSSNQQYDDVLDHLQHVDSDLIAVLELTSNWDQQIRQRLSATHPHCISSPSDDGNFGIGVYSRLPWSFADIVYFDSDLPSIQIELRDQPFRLIATHPIPPMTQKNFERRNLQLWSLSQAVNDSPLPTAVVGDLNLTPWSPIFHRFASSSQLKRVGRRESFVPTWYAKRDLWPLGLSLDHILITSSLQPCEFQIGPTIGSDHRSVTATLLGEDRLATNSIRTKKD